MPRTGSRSNKPKRGRTTPPLNEEPSGELSFALRTQSDRIGEPRARREVEKEFPRQRVREGGRRSGTMPPSGDLTADEGARDILLDEDPSHTPSLQERRQPMDTQLSVVSEAAAGEGAGKDEAELARTDPIDSDEHQRLKRRVARSGGGMANFEPNEASAGNPGRARNRRRGR